MIGVTGLGFFATNIFSGSMAPVAALMGTTPLMLAVLLGAAQNILSKSSKYSLFDPCKEMAYIPLDQESKTKGKAAIDVVCNPLGKVSFLFRWLLLLEQLATQQIAIYGAMVWLVGSSQQHRVLLLVVLPRCHSPRPQNIFCYLFASFSFVLPSCCCLFLSGWLLASPCCFFFILTWLLMDG